MRKNIEEDSWNSSENILWNKFSPGGMSSEFRTLTLWAPIKMINGKSVSVYDISFDFFGNILKYDFVSVSR